MTRERRMNKSGKELVNDKSKKKKRNNKTNDGPVANLLTYRPTTDLIGLGR